MPNVGLGSFWYQCGPDPPLALLDFLVFGGTWCENRPRLEQPCHFLIGWLLYLVLVGRCFDFTAIDAKLGNFCSRGSRWSQVLRCSNVHFVCGVE